MSADFEAEVRNSIRSLTAEVNKLAKAHEAAGRAGKKANEDTSRAARQAQATIERQWKLEGQMRRQAQTERDRPRQTLARAGLALGRFGGPVGTLATHLTGGVGLGPVLGTLAIGAGLAAVAMKYFAAQAKQAVEAVKALAEASAEASATKRANRNALLDQAATAGLSNAQLRGRLSAAPGAEDLAQTLSKASGKGIGETANAAVTLARAFPGGTGAAGNRRNNAENRVRRLVGAGMDPDEAVQAVLAAGVESGDMDYKTFDRRTAGIYARSIGAVGVSAQQAQDLLDQATKNFVTNPYASGARGIQGRNGIRDYNTLGQQFLDYGGTGADRNSDELAAPGTKALIERLAGMNDKFVELLKIQEETNRHLFSSFEDRLSVLFGDGGLSGEIRRLSSQVGAVASARPGG